MNLKNMDKTTIVNTFLSQVENLRGNAKCSQKEKIACFQQIAECVMSPPMEVHVQYAAHCTMASNVLLLFCEDFDSVVRMSAEENLNRIFRFLEKTRVSRILLDLYGEIKRNGNQRSLRICLNLFAYYAPRIKEKHVHWYAVRLMNSLQTIAQRKETQLSECLCEFVKSFGKYLQYGLTDSETCKLMEVFIANIGVECAVKRRCSAQNCISLIENSRNKSLMAKHGLNKVIELLLSNQEAHTIVGALGFLRLLLPLIIRGFRNDIQDDDTNERIHLTTTTTTTTGATPKHSTSHDNGNEKSIKENRASTSTSVSISSIPNECRQIVEIFDYCLHLLSTSSAQQQHGIINASLEVINAILQALDSSGGNTTATLTAKSLEQLLSNQQLQHNEYLRKRKSLKNQIFQQFKGYEFGWPQRARGGGVNSSQHDASMELPSTCSERIPTNQREVKSKFSSDVDVRQYIRNTARSISECVDDDVMAIAEAAAAGTTTLRIVDVDDIDDVDEDDDFTTLSEMNEPQETKSTTALLPLKQQQQQQQQSSYALTTRIDVDNLIDAIDAASIDDNTKVNNSTNKKSELESTRNLLTTTLTTVDSIGGDGDGGTALTDDKSSQHLSDFDNESFNSIDFEAEITIGGGGGGNGDEGGVTGAEADGGDTKAGNDTIGSFFNNLISHSSAASESVVSKLFRPSASSSKMTPTKSNTQSDKGDAVSLTSVSVADSLSLISTTSENKRSDVDAILEEESVNYTQRRNSNMSESPADAGADDSYSRTGSVTASTAMMVDSVATRNTTAPDCSSNDGDNDDDDDDEVEEPHKVEVEFRRKTNVNPFLLDKSPLKQTVTAVPLLTLKIGTIFEQPLLYYTARCVAARFLLTDDPQSPLQNESTSRVSIKSLSLSVIAQCVRLAPQVLQLQLEITAAELRALEVVLEAPEHQRHGSRHSSASVSPDQMRSDQSDSSHLGTDYEHVEDVAGCDLIDFGTVVKSPFPEVFKPSNIEDNSLLLDIKDDHFGKSTCDYLFNQPLSRSADPVMLAQQVRAPITTTTVTPSATPPPRPPPKKIVETNMLSKSDIVIPSRNRPYTFKITESAEDSPPPMLPPRPPKRTKSIRKPSEQKKDKPQQWPNAAVTEIEKSSSKKQQPLCNVLLYYNHLDPMLRAGVQQINGNFLQATKAGLSLQLTLNLQHLLAILSKGLQDEIHTVIIQALNAFDKIFPHVLSKYLTEPPSCHYRRQQQTERAQGETVQIFCTKQAEALKRQDNAPGNTQQQQQQQLPYQSESQSQTQAETEAKAEAHSKQQSCNANDMLYAPQSCHPRLAGETTRTLLFTDNDELIDALLNAFQLQSKCTDNNNDAAPTGTATTTALTSTSAPTTTTTTVGATNTALTASSLTMPAATTSTSRSTSFPITSADSGSAPHAHHTSSTNRCEHNTCFEFFISPKLLLDKLRLCHHNKYWLVQNKYAEVISNLNYVALRTYYEQYGNANYEQCIRNSVNPSNGTRIAAEVDDDGAVASDIVCAYETYFLDELLQLIGDADIRVRSHAAECLCRFVIQNAKQHIPPEEKSLNRNTNSVLISAESNNKNGANQKVYCKETFQTNLNLVWDFFDYSIFSSLPAALRDLFRTTASIAPPLMDQTTQGNNNNNNNNNAAGDAMTYAVAALARHSPEEEKVLAKVLYRLTNKLMTLGDKNLQFGIIYTLRLLLKHFNFVDFRRAWMEFNFIEICMKFSYYNYTTAVDLNCQCDLIDVSGKLMAGAMLVTPRSEVHQQQIDQLLTHTMKIINIYYHIFTNQKPLLFAKTQKGDLFANARELAIVQSVGYFGSDYVYIKLYNILRSANDSYKITINPESGSLLMSLLKTSLNTISLCLELRAHTQLQQTSGNVGNAPPYPPPAVLKLIEELLQYLTKLINYAPGECIACLRQLLKYLFGQNYGNRQPDYYAMLVRAYFGARAKGQQQQHNAQHRHQSKQNKENETINSSATATTATAAAAAGAVATGARTTTMSSFRQEPRLATTAATAQHDLIGTHANYAVSRNSTSTSSSSVPGSPLLSSATLSSVPDNRLFAELFSSGLSFHTWHSEREGECSRYIKLFERLVIYCLTLFMKSNAQVRAPILELLSQLLDLNVTYSILDAKNVIFDQILNNLELIEGGNARNAHIIIPPMIKFLVQLTHKSDRKLITIPKIISITNNLLANSTIRDNAVLALKALTYEIFFISPTTALTTKATAAVAATSGSGGTAATAVNIEITSITSTASTISTPIPMPASSLTATSPSSHKPIEFPPRAPFQSPVTRSPMMTPQSLSRQRRLGGGGVGETAVAAAIAAEALLSQQRELDTQKEVVLGMLEKFIDAGVCQQVFCLLLLREQCSGELETILELNADKILRARRCVEGSGIGSRVGNTAATTTTTGNDNDGHVEGQSSTASTIQSMVSILPDSGALYGTICRAMSDGRIRVRDWNDFFVLNTIFCNYGKSVLADSKEFLTLLQLFITKDVGDFSDLSYATIILANVILKTEEIYLVNHIKLYLTNQPMVMMALQREQAASSLVYDVGFLPLQDGPSTSSAAAVKAQAAARITGEGSNTISEIKYFAKVLCEKLDRCLASITGSLDQSEQCLYDGCQLAVRFVSALYDVCCRSRHKDALQSVFRLVLAESDLLDKYYNLLMMGGDTADVAISRCGSGGGGGGDGSCDYVADATAALVLLQLELFKLLSAVKLLDPLVMLQQIQAVPSLKLNVPAYVRRGLLQAIIAGSDHTKPTEPWKRRQQVLELCCDVKSVNFLIADVAAAEHRAFIYDLCQVDVEFCSLLLSALLQQANVVSKRSLRAVLQLLLCISKAQRTENDDGKTEIEINAKIIAVLAALYRLYGTESRLHRIQLVRAGCALFATFSSDQEQAIRESLQRLGMDDEQTYGCFLYLNNVNNLHETTAAELDALHTPLEQRIIDEKWLFAQLIKFSVQPDCHPQQLVKILLEIQSENKLHKIFETELFDVARVLAHAIDGSVASMLATFQHNCIQHNPHIHYMRPNPLARVAIAVLMARIEAAAPVASHAWEFCNTEIGGKENGDALSLPYLASAVIALMESIESIEATALIYIEARFIEKFVREQMLSNEQLATLLRFLSWSCKRVTELLQQNVATVNWPEIRLLMRCMSKMLQQHLIWNELNQRERPIYGGDNATSRDILNLQQRSLLLCRLLDLLVLLTAQTMQHTWFYRRYKVPLTTIASSATTTMMQSALSEATAEIETHDDDETAASIEALIHAYAPKAIFVAKLIETKIDVDATAGMLSAAHITGGGSAFKSGNGANSATALGGRGGGGGGAASAGSICGAADETVIQLEIEQLQSRGAQLPLQIFESIGIAILRTNQFYAYAVTPYEIVEQQQREQQIQTQVTALNTDAATSTGMTLPEKRSKKATGGSGTAASGSGSGKMPTIPVECLSDVDILRKFVKRLSIFGFTTRQQFEEYFMTFLLLINKLYDENMVDEQEQFHIKSTCLEAILELLITYKTFPIVGSKVATHFHHTTRCSRINCDSISLKKLHKVQLLIGETNVFYHPNLERRLAKSLDYIQTDTIIGTGKFQPNQYDLNFIWQQMESYAQPPISPTDSEGAGDFGDFNAVSQSRIVTANRQSIHSKERRLSTEDNATKNFRYFTKQSGIDFKSSSQLIFDVLMQLIDFNCYLVLPNLVKFTEICENRDQIKDIKEKAMKLQEIIPIDDTISHQHIIYLLCKTQAMLIPTFSELQQLSTLITAYLKSSHVFIRNATLQGLLSLLECCSKTNTTIGKLSEELTLLRDLILSYINRNGIIDESPIQCSDTHTKLVWTLNYCLIEWTSKFVPQCHLLSNTVIAASNFLRKTNNENVYLCVLHGLERLVVIGNNGSGANTGIGHKTVSMNTAIDAENGTGIVTPVLRHKIEKLALDLVKLENEKFSIPAVKLLLSCMYMGSSKQLENTELSNGIVQDDPEIIAQQTDKVDILLHCIKSSTRDAAWIYGQVLCQIIRDLVPPNEILTKVIKEFLAINQPHCDVIAMIVYQVFRCAIDSSFLQMLQDWLICSLPTFLALPVQKGVWGLSVIFLSASINLHLIKLFPVVVTLHSASLNCGAAAGSGNTAATATAAGGNLTPGYGAARELRKLGQHEIALFVTAAQDFHAKLSAEQKMRFRDAFKKFQQQHKVYAKMLQSL